MLHIKMAPVLSIAVLAVTALAGSAAPAGAATQPQLEKAGWLCIVPEPLTAEPHCVKPRSFTRALSGQAATFTMRVFDESGQQFLGVESNIRGDLFHGQPCPTDPPNYQYTWLYPMFGIDYWACHRFDSDHL